MEYKIDVDFAARGGEAALKTADSLEERTKRIDAALQAYLAKNDRLVNAQKTEAERQAKINELIDKYREARQKQFEADERGWRQVQAAHDAAIKEEERRQSATRKIGEDALKQNEALGASIKQWVSNPLAAAANSLESFAVQYGAMGVAAAAAGVGLAAAGSWLVKNAADAGKYAQDISNLASRTGMTTTETQLYTRVSEMAGLSAGSLTTAMRTLSRALSENSEEGKRGKAVLHELGMGADAAYRPMAELLPEIFRRLADVGSAIERDRMAIALFGLSSMQLEPVMAQFDELSQRVKQSGAIIDEQGIQKAKAYQQELNLLGMEWDSLKMKLAMGIVAPIVFQVGERGAGFFGMGDFGPKHLLELGYSYVAAPPSPEEMAGTPKTGMPSRPGAPTPDQLFHESNLSALHGYEASRDTKLGREAAIQGDIKRLTEDQKTATQDVETAKDAKARATALTELKGIDDQIEARKRELKAIQELTSQEQRLAEIRKKSYEDFDKSLNAGIGLSEATKKRNDALAGISGEEADSLRRLPSSMAPAIRAAFRQREIAAESVYREERAKEVESAKEALAEPATGQDYHAKLYEEALSDVREWMKEYVPGGKYGPKLTLPSPPPGYISPEQQLRDARFTGSANLRYAQQQRDPFTGQGESPDQIYAVRAANAQREYEAELRIAEKHSEEADKQAARLDAEDQKKQKLFEAEMDREEQIQAIREKDLQKYSSMADSLFDAIHGHTTTQFWKSFALGQARTLFSNAAAPALQTVGHALGSVVPGQNGTVLGGLLKGTVLDSSNSLQQITANSTKESADWLGKIYAAVTGQNAASPSAANPAAAAASTATSLFSASSPLAAALRFVGGPQLAALLSPSTAAAGATSYAGSSYLSAAGLSGVDLGSAAYNTGPWAGQPYTPAFTPASSEADDFSPSAAPSYMPAFTPGFSGADSFSLGSSSYDSGPWAGDTYTPAFSGAFSGSTGEANGLNLGSSTYDSGPWAGQAYTPAFDQASPPPSTSGSSTFNGVLGGAAGLGTAGFGIYSGIKEGGAAGGLLAGGSALGAVGAGLSLVQSLGGALGSVASAIPILGAVAPLLGMISGLFSNGPQQRQQQITDDLAKNQYLAPTALNVTQGMNGTYEDFDARGNLRTSNFSALPTVAEPYITKRTLDGQQGWYDAPGVVTAPYSGGATGTGVTPVSNAPGAGSGGTVIIQTMDSQSFQDFAEKNHAAIGNATLTHLMSGSGERLASAIQYHTNG